MLFCAVLAVSLMCLCFGNSVSEYSDLVQFVF